MITRTVNESLATVGAYEDLDGYVEKVFIISNRTDEEYLRLVMEPRVARRLARQLNKWAKRAEGK